MINIILIIPPSPDNRKITRLSNCSFESKGYYLLHQHDFLAITSCLKPEDGVSFIDGTCDQLSEDDFFNKVSQLKGDMLFFSLSNACWNSDHYYFEKTIKKLKFPDIPIFVIGDIFLDEDFRENILKECDGVVFYPYELDLEKMVKFKDNKDELLPGVFTKLNQNFFKKPKKLTVIHSDSFPRHELFMKSGYRFPFARHIKFATIVLAYGCPNICTFCSFSNLPPAVRLHSSVLKELEYLEGLGIKELYFRDAIFGYYERESIPLLEEMKKRFTFSWSCFLSLQVCTTDFLELLHAAGCHTIIIGIESSNPSTLKNTKRGWGNKKSGLESFIVHANKLKMSVCADFIIGLEDETEEDINNTIKFGLTLPLDAASFNVVVPRPGTVIRENLKKKGISSKDLVDLDPLGHTGNIGNRYLSGEKIIKLRNKAVRKFYLRPALIFRRLRKTSSYEHFIIQFQEMLSILKKSVVSG